MMIARVLAWIVMLVVVGLGASCAVSVYHECRTSGHSRLYCWQLVG